MHHTQHSMIAHSISAISTGLLSLTASLHVAWRRRRCRPWSHLGMMWLPLAAVALLAMLPALLRLLARLMVLWKGTGAVCMVSMSAGGGRAASAAACSAASPSAKIGGASCVVARVCILQCAYALV